MSHDEIINTLQEIMDYFEACMANTAPISKARKQFRRYMEALRYARADELGLKWQEDDGK
jgi:hypothetical protein